MKKLIGGMLAIGLVVASATSAGASVRNNHAYAFTHNHRTQDVHVVWQIAGTNRDVVVANNTAVATSTNCTSCKTTAIAIAVDLATSNDVNSITANDTATAINTFCVLCDTTALAYQFLVASGGPETLTTGATAAIEAIMDTVQADALSTEPGSQLATDVDGLMAQVETILSDTTSFTVVAGPVHIRLFRENLRNIGFTDTSEAG